MHNKDIEELLIHCESEINIFSDSVENGEINRVQLKNTMENMRSTLDYLAQDILERLKLDPNNQNLPDKVYFPYGQRQNHFKKSIKRNLPNLADSEPEIHRIIEGIQPFRSKDNWLVDLCNLTNDAKHNKLSKTERKQTTVVHQKGFARSENTSNSVMSNNYVNGVRQDDVYWDKSGDVSIVQHSNTTEITKNNRIRFHGKELEIVPFLKKCHEELVNLSENVAKVLCK